jgi:hypothetical protein
MPFEVPHVSKSTLRIAVVLEGNMHSLESFEANAQQPRVIPRH